LEKYDYAILVFILTIISTASFIYYLNNGLGLAYNDARSHLDIGRRVVEGLKPGFAQLGSVWLPLPHLLMVPTIWNDFFWHTGLSGALQSMLSFIATGLIIYYYLKKLGVSLLGRIVGVVVFVANINILYMQSTAMTELLLIATMTAAAYELLLWYQKDKLLNLVKASFWVMLATLIRYDGWFLFVMTAGLIAFHVLRVKKFKAAEAYFLFFCTLAGFGIVLWFLWNLLIFKDPLYFAFGPYSAHAQQAQLDEAGVLVTKRNLLFSLKVYLYALAYNSGMLMLVLGLIGSITLWLDRKLKSTEKIATLALFAPLIFNIIALYLGHSVLFIQGLSGDTWFNVRYGLVMMPGIAIFIGYLVWRSGKLKYLLIGLILLTLFFAFANNDAVTIDDARVGSSQKNVTEVSGWLNKNAKDRDGFVLISAASHDAIIFSSGLPMKKFIHEGTGAYWESATASPDRWARWIVMRTNDNNDQTFRLVKKSGALYKYELIDSYPFADIYELKPQYLNNLQTKPVLKHQK
jgi:uncharacterized membrane protein (Fun14 family)